MTASRITRDSHVTTFDRNLTDENTRAEDRQLHAAAASGELGILL